MSKLDTHVILAEGLAADIPDLSDPLILALYPIGALYSTTDTSIIYRRDEDDTWHAWATLAGVLPDPSGEPDGQVLQTSGGAAIWDPDPGGGGGSDDYVLIQDQKSAGTGGGAATSGSWFTRDLNTEVADTGGNSSISSNQITLAAGTYRCLAFVPAWNVDYHKARLRDITNTATLIAGTSAYNPSSYPPTPSILMGRFTIAGATVIEVQHQVNTTQASTSALGVAVGFSVIEVYTTIEFWKEQ